MNNVAIEVVNLSKEYHTGRVQNSHYRLTDQVADIFAAPFRRAGKLLRGQASGAAELDGTFWALKDVSFQIRPGEVVGIIGRNGAGKSTLFKILSGITDPTEGYADIYGRVGSLLEVGTGFHPELTGRENIYLNGAILGMTKAEISSKFVEIVEFAEIGKFIDTPIKHYSSGMYVRLAFSVAAHLEPEILLVDEVLAVGDADFRKKCLGKMGEVAQQGRTVLFISHNMGAIMDLTERCIFIQSGQVVADGPSRQIIEEYLRGFNMDLSRDVSTVKRTVAVTKPLWRLHHVKILAAESKLTANESIEIELTYTAYADLEDVTIGVGIANTFGTRLISCRSDDDGKYISTKEGESGTVLVRIDSPYLAPGRYILQVVAMQNINTLDYLSDALTFEISTDVDDQWTVNRSNLGVRLPSTWRCANGQSENRQS
jgi:lipopolysaccharide transport system ATP-binding protein